MKRRRRTIVRRQKRMPRQMMARIRSKSNWRIKMTRMSNLEPWPCNLRLMN